MRRRIKHQFMVRLLIANYDVNLEKKILNRLNELIGIYHLYNPSVKLFTKEVYWKFPDLMECIFLVEFKKEIFFLNFIKVFNFNRWQDVFVTPCYDSEKPDDKFLDEEVIWSKNVDKEGVFIDENVEWAHIYTWDY